MNEIIKTPATQYYVVVDGHSWASFIITEKGDLFINSDWGYWCYNWRAFGPPGFKAFLADLGVDYLIAKLETNQLQMLRGKKTIEKRPQQAIKALFAKFQEELKKEIANGPDQN